MASFATENPQFDSTLNGWITSHLSISGQEVVMEIPKSDHLTQLTALCKHVNQFFLEKYNQNRF